MAHKIENKMVAVNKLILDEANPRTHPGYQVEKLARAMERVGFTNPVLVDQDYKIIAGHGRVMAAEMIGLAKVPARVIHGLSDPEKEGLKLEDNSLGDESTWNDDLLREKLQALVDAGFEMDNTGFDEFEIEGRLAQDLDDTFGSGAEGEVKFSEEIGEANNYFVIVVKNDIDWESAKTRFGFETVASKRQNGKPWSKGVGRVIEFNDFLKRIGAE